MKKCLLTFVLSLSIGATTANAQAIFETEIPLQENERWWGGAAGIGAQMPFSTHCPEFDLTAGNASGQTAPLLVSSRGRYVWSDKPFKFEIKERSLVVRSYYGIVEPALGGKTLREAYQAACERYFKASGATPDSLLFLRPQYNTRMEPTARDEAGILQYAQGIVDAGLPPGVLIIDDGWQKYYGSFEFDAGRFADPKGMIDKLHTMGFKVMLWVSPFVSPDSPESRTLNAEEYLIRQKGTQLPAVLVWANGLSACLDMTNPEAKAHIVNQLRELQSLCGVDGFDFGAGDTGPYTARSLGTFDTDAIAVDHTRAWAALALEFSLAQGRSCWKMGGQPLALRLAEREHSWDAVAALVPDAIAAGLLGHAYVCPGMVGGAATDGAPDQKLIVRWAQIHAMMPMMQFSMAPWSELNAENMESVRKAVALHTRLAPYIMECARQAAITGEPIVRHMDYGFPLEDFEECRDQYMLGDRFLVAPIVTGEDHRDVKLPRGRWRDDTGHVYRGGMTISIKAPLDRIPYFEKM